MWKPIQAPGEWLVFLTREDNKGVSLMEVRRKYMQEQLLFENYMSHLQTLDTLQTINPLSSAPASAPSVANGREVTFDLKVVFYNNGVEGGTSRYYRSSTPDEPSGTYEYRNIQNFSIGCDFRRVRWTGGYWEERDIPCGAKAIPTNGPTTIDSPLGVYGDGDVGPGAGRIVTNWP